MLIINLFAIISLLSLSAILLFRKNNSTTNILLALIISNPAVNFINNVFVLTGVINHFPEMVFISYISGPLYAPLILAYCRKMIGKEVKLRTWFHGITLAIIIMVIGFYIQFLTFSPEAKQNYLVGLNNSVYPWQLNLCNALVFLIQLVYIGTAIYEIYRFGKSSRQFFANIEKTKLSYLRLFAVLLGVLTFLLLVCYATIPTRIVEYIIIPIICISIYVFVLYFAFQKSAIFAQKEYDDFAECLVPLKRYDDYSEPLCQEIKAIKANRGKYKIAEVEMEVYYKKISEYFEKEKPYLLPDISLLTLSEAIGACSHHVSMTINVKFEMNFFNLINSYRIREAKSLLENKILMTGATVEQIGYDVGFQTKSTFYNAFKTHVGASPTNYLKSIANNN